LEVQRIKQDGKKEEAMSRVPIIRLYRSIIFDIKYFFTALFYYFPLWMKGNRWCDRCSIRIRPTDYLAEVEHCGAGTCITQYYCKECEEDCT